MLQLKAEIDPAVLRIPINHGRKNRERQDEDGIRNCFFEPLSVFRQQQIEEKREIDQKGNELRDEREASHRSGQQPLFHVAVSCGAIKMIHRAAQEKHHRRVRRGNQRPGHEQQRHIRECDRIKCSAGVLKQFLREMKHVHRRPRSQRRRHKTQHEDFAMHESPDSGDEIHQHRRVARIRQIEIVRPYPVIRFIRQGVQMSAVNQSENRDNQQKTKRSAFVHILMRMILHVKNKEYAAVGAWQRPRRTPHVNRS